MILLIATDSVLFWLYALLIFVLVLGVIILIHEGGHWYFAHKAGILCYEYSIGMGPIIKRWKRKGKETDISIRSIPIGGYVSMAGEDTNEEMLKKDQEIYLDFENTTDPLDLKGEYFTSDEVVSRIIVAKGVEGHLKCKVSSYDLYSKDGDPMWIEVMEEGKEEPTRYLVKRDARYVLTKKETIQVGPYDRCFESKSLGKRAITIFAGPMMNFVLALFIFLIVSFASGVPNYDSSVIGEVSEGSSAYDAGILSGDEIVSINGQSISEWTDISTVMGSVTGDDAITVVVNRDGTNLTKTMIPTVVNYRLGITNAFDRTYDGEGIKVSLVFSNDYVCGKAGIENDDIILGYYDNDTYVSISGWKELNDYIISNNNDSIKLKVKDKGDITSGMWTKESLKDLSLAGEVRTQIGVSCGTHFDFFGCLGNAFVLLWESITTVFVTLGALFANSQITINDLSGPVGIYSAVKSYLQTDVITFLSFVGLISANIGVVNLLPIPALDGGRLVFIAYEAITKKKPSKKFETLLNNIVFWAIMLLFVYITIKDVIRLF